MPGVETKDPWGSFGDQAAFAGPSPCPVLDYFMEKRGPDPAHLSPRSPRLAQ
jgi:hypothetical protein